MNPQWRRFAPLGLYLALLAALASAGLAIVQRTWNLPLQISLALVVLGLALFALLDPDRVRVALTGRQARYGSNALVLSVAFIGILVVANYLIYQNSNRWDLTEDKNFTLASETLETLEKLPGEVNVQAFFTPNTSSESARKLLDQYKFHSQGKLDFQFIDPVEDPLAAQAAKITRDGSLVLSMAGNQEVVSTVSEQEMTNALVRLISPEKRAIYFLSGHGEYDPEGSGDEAYSFTKRTLESKNYTVQKVSLLATNQIPADAKVMVVGGPRKPLDQAEVDLLAQFVANGGSLVVMQEPIPLTEFGEAADPLAGYLETNWGIVLGNDVIVDVTSNQASLFAVGIEYGNHPIVQKLEGMYTIFPTARSVSINGTMTPGLTQVELVKTASQAWAETDIAALQSQNAQVAPDASLDLIGPVPMAVAAENFNSNGRVVVFGDADFATDGNFTAYGNGDMLVNSIDWAAGQEDLISLTAKDNTARKLSLPPQQWAMNLILLGVVVIIPGLPLASGIAVWVQRRRRG